MTNVVNMLVSDQSFRTQARSVDAKDISGLEAHVIEALSTYRAGAWRMATESFLQESTLRSLVYIVSSVFDVM